MPHDLNLTTYSSRQCVHTKNVYSLMDLSPSDESYKNLSKHVESCPACSKELQKFKIKFSAALVFIPKAVMDRDLRQSFEREVGELFKVLQLSEREVLKSKVKNKFKTIDQMGIEFIKTLSSKRMIGIYLIAAIMYLALKLYS